MATDKKAVLVFEPFDDAESGKQKLVLIAVQNERGEEIEPADMRRFNAEWAADGEYEQLTIHLTAEG